MEMADFIRFFSKVELCNLQTARIDEDDDAQMNWVTTIHEVTIIFHAIELYLNTDVLFRNNESY